MKYEVPEINISRFSVENVVTLSAVGQAEEALNTAYEAVNGTTVTVKTSINDWVAAN